MSDFIVEYVSIIITLLTVIFGIGISLVQFWVGKRNDAKELEIKYNIDKISFRQELKKDKMQFTNINANYLHKLLELHHNQALQQANIQFWFSILAAVLGFGLIIFIIFFGQNKIWYEYIIRVIPGAIIEVISVLFINQARETRDRATNFFKELNYDKKIEKSIEIAESIDDKEIESTVKSKIALHIIGICENNTNGI